jgi:type IV secretion system protein TrbI
MNSQIESPTGLDLNPRPPEPMRVSKRAGLLALSLVALVILLIVYGIYRRGQQQLHAPYAPDNQARVQPSQIPTEIASQISPGVSTAKNLEASSPGETLTADSTTLALSLRTHGKSTQLATRPYPGPVNYPTAPTLSPPPYGEVTAEDRRRALAYEQEQQAIDAPTAVRAADGGGSGASLSSSVGLPTTQADATTLAALGNLLPAPPGMQVSTQDGTRQPAAAASLGSSGTSQADGYREQNMQDRKEAFLARARTGGFNNYLSSTRSRPVCKYEIKAGWIIPAVLEQALNSDLPGETRALVRENVYDTATGKHRLIPQGARLVGTYDPHIAYGQDGIQVAWHRIIYPDASSINLDGMIGEDAQGNAGMRHKVDNHYKRLIGFAVLTSLFSAGFELSQPRRGSLLTVPTPGEIVGGAVGREISQLGVEVTRRNLNVQPTIRVPVGYRFSVRVNRDILFDSPYTSITPSNSLATAPRESPAR